MTLHNLEVSGVRKLGMSADAEGAIPLMAIEVIVPLEDVLELELGPGARVALELEPRDPGSEWKRALRGGE